MSVTTLPKYKFSAEDWQIIPVGEEKDYYTVNDVIDAYIKGKDEGMDQAKKIIMKSLGDNVGKTVIPRNEMYKFLKKKQFNPTIAYLKIIAWYSFELLILIPESEFLEDKFLEVYDFSSGLEAKINDDLFNLTFRFTYLSKNLDDKKLGYDGFKLKHKFDKN